MNKPLSGKSTAQRAADYIAELRKQGIEVKEFSVKRGELVFKLGDGETEINPADLVSP